MSHQVACYEYYPLIVASDKKVSKANGDTQPPNRPSFVVLAVAAAASVVIDKNSLDPDPAWE